MMEAAQSSEIPLDLIKPRQKQDPIASVFRLLSAAQSSLDLALNCNKRTIAKLKGISVVKTE